MTNKSDELVCIKNCDFGYDGTAILKDISLHIYEGEFIAIVGPNGSGKTTLLKTLLGLHPLLSGTITKNLKDIGYVPQHAQLNLSIPITVEEFLDLKVRSKSENYKHLVHTLGLSDESISKKPINQLSTGQRQRLLVAFALLGKPKLICLDEATDGLDFKAQKEFFSLLKNIQVETKSTVILISHDITAVGSHATRAICLNRSLLYDGMPNSPEFHSCLHNIYGRDSVIHHHDHEHKH